MDQNRKEKIAIAHVVARIIHDGDAVAIDTGSTSGFIAQALRQHKNLTVVTNSAFIASTLAMVPGNRVFMAGTQLRSHDGAAFDKAAFDLIASSHSAFSILSASSVHPKRGFLVQEQCEFDMAQAMMRSSDRRIMAVDHSKFHDQQAFLSLPRLESGDLIVLNEMPGTEFSELLADKIIQLAGDGK